MNKLASFADVNTSLKKKKKKSDLRQVRKAVFKEWLIS